MAPWWTRREPSSLELGSIPNLWRPHGGKTRNNRSFTTKATLSATTIDLFEINRNQSPPWCGLFSRAANRWDKSATLIRSQSAVQIAANQTKGPVWKRRAMNNNRSSIMRYWFAWIFNKPTGNLLARAFAFFHSRDDLASQRVKANRSLSSLQVLD